MFHTANTIQKSNTEAVAYLRVSDRRQNLETQRAKAIKYAEKNNLHLDENMIFPEKQPASNTADSPIVSDLTVVFKSRPKLLKILLMASRKEFSHLIVYSSDRLARDVFQNALIKQHLEKNKIQIHFTKEGENFKNDPLSMKLQNILACFAEFEASTISSRVFDSLTQVFNRGDWTGGRAPLSFTLVNTPTGKALDIDKTKIDIAKTAFELYSNGYGYRKIADILSQKYFPYQFKKSTIEYMLSNDVYFGILSWCKKGGRRKNNLKNEVYLTSEHKKELDIVGIENKNLIDLLKKFKGNIKDPQYFSSPYILKDLLICSKCGKKLIPKNYGKNKASVYRCPTKENSKSHNIVKTKLIEKLVLEKLSNIKYCEEDISASYDKYISSFKEKTKMHNDIIQALNNKISELENNIKNIDDMLSENPQQHVTNGLLKYKHYFQDKISLFTKQLGENKKQLNSEPISLNEFTIQIHNIIKQIPNKRMLCFLVIDKILVSNDNNQLKLDIIISPKTL